MMAASAETITAGHLAWRAYIYVRQSSPGQVQHHRESQRNQYALAERAVALGWPPARIHVIDADLGQSGQDGRRPGFQELVSAVSLGQVGIIFAYEASRLARSNADWYRLLDLAALMGTLLADADGIYDPSGYNDRLLLGLRGMLSEAELHLLQLRLEAGRMRQIERGTYRQSLPTGLVRLADGRVVKDPDLQIQRTIELVFARFTALGTCQKVLRSLRDDGLLLPRRQVAGLHAGQLLWKRPSAAALYDILRNPAYAGAFVYGRKGRNPDHRPDQARQVRRPVEEWTVVHREVYPAYITWEQYLANQMRLTDNASDYRAVDPDNRLVAATLERDWEAALQAIETAREAAERFAGELAPSVLDPALWAQLTDLGRELPALWASGRLTPAHQKELLRSLIRRVVLSRPAPDTVEARVVWVSGAASLHVIAPPVHCSRDLGDYDRLVTRTLELAAAGYQDGAIAERLSAEGFRSARSCSVPKQLVEKIRRDHARVSLTEQFRRQDKIDSRWTVGGLARELHVTGNWLRRQIAAGMLPAVRHPLIGRYLIEDDPTALARLKTLAAARQAPKEVVSCHR